MLRFATLPAELSMFAFAAVLNESACASTRNTRHFALRTSGLLQCSSPKRRPASRRAFSTSSRNSTASSSSQHSSTPPTSPEPASTRATPSLRFTFAASYLGKPPDPDLPSKKQRSFKPDHPIIPWRQAQLEEHGRFARLLAEAQKSKSKSTSAGDDFLFLAPSHDGTSIIGLADGVGGWSESGVDPSVFSQALMFYASREAEHAQKSQSEGDIHPHDLLQIAYEEVLKDSDVVAGSSTACLITLDPLKRIMRAANLGDSSFALHRGGKVLHNQPAQVHYFNCPFQLSKLPKALRNDPGSIIDQPSQADLFEAKVEDGDLLIAYTDGFGDNVWMKEVEILIQKVSEEKLGKTRFVEKLADTLVSYARLCSNKTDKKSPFEHEASRNGLRFRGGKVDDICVIVTLVEDIGVD